MHFCLSKFQISASSDKKKAYSDSCIEYGFTDVNKQDKDLQQNVIYHKALSEGFLERSLLQRHFSNSHPKLSDKHQFNFERETHVLKGIGVDYSGPEHKLNEASLRASFMVAWRVAQNKKPHTVVETFVLPCCKDIIGCFFGENAAQKLNTLSLSNDIMHQRICDLSEDIKDQVIAEIKEAPLGIFAIQLDESTDISACAQLLAYTRYIKDSDFKEEFLFSHPLESTTTGEDIFEAVSSFFEKEGLSWENMVGCTTDGSSALLGCQSSFHTRMKAANPSTRKMHCMSHHYALSVKTLPPELKTVLDDVVVMVNFIKNNPLNTRILRLLCQELNAEEEALLSHTDVRWLSRGNVVARFATLLEELKEFFDRIKKEKTKKFVNKLSDNKWITKLAYLNDIFSRIDGVNRSLQNYSATVIDSFDKLRDFQKKLRLWEEKVTVGRYDIFENTSDSLSALCKDDVDEVIGLIQKHLVSLSQELDNYFPDITDLDRQLIQKPLKMDPTSLPDELQEEFFDLVNNPAAADSFDSLSLTGFWSTMASSYPALTKKCVQSLLVFPTTYCCEQGFSALVLMENKLRSHVTVTDGIRVALSKIVPRIDLLVAKTKV